MASYLINVGDIVQFTTRAFLDGQTILNTFHYRCLVDQTDGVSALQIAIAAFDTSVQNPMTLAQSDDVTYLPTMGQKIFPLRFVPEFNDVAANPDGQIQQVALPTTVSGVVRRRTVLAGPANRGRIFIAGIPVTGVLESKLTSAQLALMNAVGNGMLDKLAGEVGESFAPVIYSREFPESSGDVVTHAVDPILRVQRRREIGVGV